MGELAPPEWGAVSHRAHETHTRKWSNGDSEETLCGASFATRGPDQAEEVSHPRVLKRRDRLELQTQHAAAVGSFGPTESSRITDVCRGLCVDTPARQTKLTGKSASRNLADSIRRSHGLHGGLRTSSWGLIMFNYCSTKNLLGVGGHSWELGPVPISKACVAENTEVNLPGDSGGSVFRKATRNLDSCQLHVNFYCWNHR